MSLDDLAKASIMDANIETLMSDLKTINSKMDDLCRGQTSDANEAKITIQNAEIEKNETRLQSQKKKMEENETETQKHETKMEENRTILKNQNETIKENKTMIQNQNETIKENKTTLKNHNETMEENNTTLKNQNEAMEKNKTSIHQQQIKSAELTNEIETLKKDKSEASENYVEHTRKERAALRELTNIEQQLTEKRQHLKDSTQTSQHSATPTPPFNSPENDDQLKFPEMQSRKRNQNYREVSEDTSSEAGSSNQKKNKKQQRKESEISRMAKKRKTVHQRHFENYARFQTKNLPFYKPYKFQMKELEDYIEESDQSKDYNFSKMKGDIRDFLKENGVYCFKELYSSYEVPEGTKEAVYIVSRIPKTI